VVGTRRSVHQGPGVRVVGTLRAGDGDEAAGHLELTGRRRADPGQRTSATGAPAASPGVQLDVSPPSNGTANPKKDGTLLGHPAPTVALVTNDGADFTSSPARWALQGRHATTPSAVPPPPSKP
jgi:hypothetical protein